jgi:hypothetical protein
MMPLMEVLRDPTSLTTMPFLASICANLMSILISSHQKHLHDEHVLAWTAIYVVSNFWNVWFKSLDTADKSKRIHTCTVGFQPSSGALGNMLSHHKTASGSSSPIKETLLLVDGLRAFSYVVVSHKRSSTRNNTGPCWVARARKTKIDRDHSKQSKSKNKARNQSMLYVEIKLKSTSGANLVSTGGTHSSSIEGCTLQMA